MNCFYLYIVAICTVLSSLCACSPAGEKHKSPTPLATPSEKETSKDGYPAHWWQEVPRQDAKSWEILPQDAGAGEVVLSKRNELGLLSNFASTSFVFHGVCYPSVEGFWQMMKYPEGPEDVRWSWAPKWKWTRAQVSLMNGYDAKKAGNYVNYLMDRNDVNWVTFEGRSLVFASKEPGEHYQLILNALIEKVRQNPEVLDVLLKTKGLRLIPDHKISSEAPREWHYNLLWMDVRDSINEGSLSLETTENLSLKTCKAQRF